MSLVASFRVIRRVGNYVNCVVFGKNLLLTNALISAGMGTTGDAIQQHYDLLRSKIKGEKNQLTNAKFNFTRSFHMTAAGLTTGVVSHYWYIYLDRFLSTRRVFDVVLKKVLYDQILFSPVNLIVYFTTLGIMERSGVHRVKEELVEKGFQNIYVAEWVIWPPAQFFNFYCLPLRYRILFDNIISLGFDIYSPYIKYKTQLKSEKTQKESVVVLKENDDS